MTVTDYDTDVDPEQPTPETLLAATLALDAAISQLVEPGLERLDRSRPEADEAVQAVEAEAARTAAQELARDHHRETQLRKQIAAAEALNTDLGNRRAKDVRRTLVALRLQMRANAAERERRAHARAISQAALPSLIEQLQDAVAGTGGNNGAPGSGAYRSPIGLAAAELIGHIQRTVWARPADNLTTRVREWAQAVTAEQNPTVLPECALAAEQWVTRARQILAPDRGFEIPEPCPHCGNRYAHVLDDTGTKVRKSALYVGYADQVARCLHYACGSRWPKTHWDHLKALLEQRRNEREAG